ERNKEAKRVKHREVVAVVARGKEKEKEAIIVLITKKEKAKTQSKYTRKTFTDHLYTSLVQAGFQTFRDNDSIERGKYLNLELPKAIKRSRISIVVLSGGRDELVTILECNRTHENAVLPVFYDAEPSEVRKQVGSFGEALLGHENEVEAEGDHEKRMELEKRVKRWKAALRQVADLTGMVLNNQADGAGRYSRALYMKNVVLAGFTPHRPVHFPTVEVYARNNLRHEAKFIKKIVKVVGDKLKRTVLNVAPHLIGIDLRARNINSWLRDESNDVGIVAICGIGGIGKTTIAKYLYDLNFESFKGSSFLASVREVSEQPDGLIRQLLSDILKGKKEKIYNVDQRIVRIKEALCCRKVLVVLDDVDQVDQLDAVLGMRDYLYPGSKVIITTRQKQLLKASNGYEMHQVIGMDDIESFELFSWYAFGQDHPIEGHMDYSERVVHYCDGLPLALQVLGSSLRGKSIDVWESALEKLEAILLDGQILKKLKISYDSLQDDHDKNLFLDIACLFVGKDKDRTITIRDGCGCVQNKFILNLIALDTRYSSLETVRKGTKVNQPQLGCIAQQPLELEGLKISLHEEYVLPDDQKGGRLRPAPICLQQLHLPIHDGPCGRKHFGLYMT
ncbi:LOW QUALITY PROTEIN: hypothetical protein RJ640_006248, partial [Escallonia rubra]